MDNPVNISLREENSSSSFISKIYVADALNHRTVAWRKDAKEGSIVVGGNNRGNQSKQLHCPIGLSFDNENNLYVVDCDNHRIQKFTTDK